MLGEFWHSVLAQGSLSAFLWPKKPAWVMSIHTRLKQSSFLFLFFFSDEAKTLILKYHKVSFGKSATNVICLYDVACQKPLRLP